MFSVERIFFQINMVKLSSPDKYSNVTKRKVTQVLKRTFSNDRGIFKQNPTTSKNVKIIFVKHKLNVLESLGNSSDLNPFSPAKTTFCAELSNPITRQAIELESCSKPL